MPRGGVNSVASEGAPEYKFDEYDLPDLWVGIYQGAIADHGIDKNDITNRVGVQAFSGIHWHYFLTIWDQSFCNVY